MRSAERAALIYLESQYFASHKIGEALAARLREADGPEIVVVNPQAASGWLEEEVMGSARALILRDARRGGSARPFPDLHPVAAGGTPIYVHAKIMIVDDTFLRGRLFQPQQSLHGPRHRVRYGARSPA